jgi:toxin ParE1/3/4
LPRPKHEGIRLAAKIYQAAKERILEIWDYTERTWGEEQADKYVRGLVDAINAAEGKRHQWRRVADESLSGVYFIRYQHHYLFFRELSGGTLGVERTPSEVRKTERTRC